MKRNQSLAMMITSVIIFGTIGLFRRWIPISSSLLAFVRGAVGAIFLLLIWFLRKRLTVKKINETTSDKSASAPQHTLWKKLLWFGIPGVFIGLNWVLLFEAYRLTTVAVATLCYYMAPTFVILLSPLVLREKLSLKSILCAVAAVAGMVLISGIWGGEGGQLGGVLFGLGAAAFYAGQILVNKKAPEIDVYERTMIELAAAALCLLPYLLLTGEFSVTEFSLKTALLLLVVGVVHTGVTYALYFGSMGGLKAQTVALLSYLDPVVALLLSWLILKEPLSVSALVGAILILGSALISETKWERKASP